jgi:hypothetical protein
MRADDTMTTFPRARTRPGTEFRRDRLTWIAYALTAWFAYLQAAPALLVGHLRDELDLSYSTGGLHVAAFAAGSMAAGMGSARLERALGRRALLWSAAALTGHPPWCRRTSGERLRRLPVQRASMRPAPPGVPSRCPEWRQGVAPSERHQ